MQLLRACAAALTVEAAPNLGNAAVAALAAGFGANAQLRAPLLDAMLSEAMPNLPAARGTRAVRSYPAGVASAAPAAKPGGDGGASNPPPAPSSSAAAAASTTTTTATVSVVIQPFSAALLAMLAAAAELPSGVGGSGGDDEVEEDEEGKKNKRSKSHSRSRSKTRDTSSSEPSSEEESESEREEEGKRGSIAGGRRSRGRQQRKENKKAEKQKPPPSTAGPTTAQRLVAGYAPALAAADALWNTLLDRLAGARAAKADTAVDLKAASDELIADVAVCVPLPRWPAAGPALLRLAGSLFPGTNGPARGLRSPDTAARAAAVDLLGAATAALCALVVEAEAAAWDASALLDSCGVFGGGDAGAAVPAGGLPGLSPEARLLLCYLATTATSAESESGGGGGKGGAGLFHDDGGLDIDDKNLSAAAASHAASLAFACGASSTGGGDSRADARRFILARALAEWATGPDGPAAASSPSSSSAAAAAAAVATRDAAEDLARGVAADLGPADGALLARAAAAAGAEGRARASLLGALVEASDPGRQAPTARAHAVRAVAAAVRADARLARTQEAQLAIGRALRDEAASVRQAAVDALGSAVEKEPALAATFFDALAAAARDAAPSVRKSALRIIDEKCVRAPPGVFNRRADAAVALVAAAADSEEGVSDAAAKALADLWFGVGIGGGLSAMAAGPSRPSSGARSPAGPSPLTSPAKGVATGGGASAAAAAAAAALAPAADRAAALADAAAAASAAASAAGGPGLRLPLEPTHPLPAAVRAALACAAVSPLYSFHSASSPASKSMRPSATGERRQSSSGAGGGGGSSSPPGADVALALLEVAVSELASARAGALPPASLLALHALTVAEPSLASPKKDPSALVRCLAPYVKAAPPSVSADGGGSNDDSNGAAAAAEADRRDADRLVATLAVLATALSSGSASGTCGSSAAAAAGNAPLVGSAASAAELARDLASLINGHPFIHVVAAACRALAALAEVSIPAERAIGHWAAKYLAQLGPGGAAHPSAAAASDGNNKNADASAATASAFAARFLFVLGHLFRHGGNAIERSPAPADGTPPATAAGCLAAALAHFENPRGDPKAREAALHALGCLAVSAPAAVLGPRARRTLRAALSPAAPPAFKLRALHNLGELLRAEEARLVVAQRAASASNALGGAPVGAASSAAKAASSSAAAVVSGGACGGGGGGDPKARAAAAAAASAASAVRAAGGSEAEAAAAASSAAAGAAAATSSVPDACGAGDSLSLSSGMIQDSWEACLRLALDASPVPPAPTGGGPRDPRHAAVRRAAVALMDSVDRGGLVAPWTAVPTLVAAATDPAPDVAARALRVLRRVAGKAPDMFRATVADGLPLAARLHADLARAFASTLGSENNNSADALAALDVAASLDVARGVGALYADLIQSTRPARHAFLGRLLRKLDAACDVHGRGGEGADLASLAAVAQASAALPMRRADEPLMLIRSADDVVSRRGEAALSALQRALKRGGRREKRDGEGGGEEEDNDSDGGGGGNAAVAPLSPLGRPPPRAEVASALAASILLLLRKHIAASYSLTPERIAAFAGSAERRKTEERLHASARGGGGVNSLLSLSSVLPAAALSHVPPPAESKEWWDLGVSTEKVLRELLAEAAAEAAEAAAAFGEANLAAAGDGVGGSGGEGGSGDNGEDGVGSLRGGEGGGSRRRKSPTSDVASPASASGRSPAAARGRGRGAAAARGRGTAAAARGRGRGGRGAAAAAARSRKKRRGSFSSEEDEESSADEDSE